MISVISEEVKATLVARGIDADKILVNPNGADLDGVRARRLAGATRASARRLGFDPTATGRRLHRNLRRLARRRRAGGRRFRRSASAFPRAFPADRRRQLQAPRRRRRWPRTACRTACTASAACRRPTARGCSRRATSTCRRTTATWSTAGSSARRPRSSSTGDGRRHRRQRSRTDRRDPVAGPDRRTISGIAPASSPTSGPCSARPATSTSSWTPWSRWSSVPSCGRPSAGTPGGPSSSTIRGRGMWRASGRSSPASASPSN